jgi:acyl dehydratase
MVLIMGVLAHCPLVLRTPHHDSQISHGKLFLEEIMTTVIKSIEDLKAHIGTDFGFGPWHTVTQEQVNLFADATLDHQWIHVDPERAKSGPFGAPIAHGYLTLSMIPYLIDGVMEIEGVKMGVNYGTNKVRFANPVPVGSEIHAGFTLASVDEFEGGVQFALDVIVEARGATKPACAAQVVYRRYF